MSVEERYQGGKSAQTLEAEERDPSSVTAASKWMLFSLNLPDTLISCSNISTSFSDIGTLFSDIGGLDLDDFQCVFSMHLLLASVTRLHASI